jgi:integrase
MKLYRQKKSKFWWVDHTFPNGDRIRESTKVGDKSLARMRAEEIIEQYENKERIVARRGSFFAEYLEYARPRKSPKTITGEIRMWEDFTKFVGTDSPVEVSEQMIDKFFTHLLGRTRRNEKEKTVEEVKKNPPKRLSVSYVNSYNRVLRMIFNKAVRWKYAVSNPFLAVDMMRFEPDPPRFLTQSELIDLIDATRAMYPHLVPVFQFFFLTGMRRAEVLGLTWDKIDFERKLITVSNTKGKRVRFVPMTPMAERILQQRRKLPRPFMEHIDTTSHQFKFVAEKAGIPEVSLHDLRRSFATHLAPKINKTLLQQLIGHDDYSVTDVFYIGSNAESVRGEMSVLDRMLLAVKNKN